MKKNAQAVLRPWIPAAGIPEVLYCESISDSDQGIQIELASKESLVPIIRITFESVIAYQNVNETYRRSAWSKKSKPQPTLLIVEGDAWLSWLVQESGGVLDNVEMCHYAIYTPEDCIDVVSSSAPRVEFIQKPSAE